MKWLRDLSWNICGLLPGPPELNNVSTIMREKDLSVQALPSPHGHFRLLEDDESTVLVTHHKNGGDLAKWFEHLSDIGVRDGWVVNIANPQLRTGRTRLLFLLARCANLSALLLARLYQRLRVLETRRLLVQWLLRG
jgi:hypothetical protein